MYIYVYIYRYIYIYEQRRWCHVGVAQTNKISIDMSALLYRSIYIYIYIKRDRERD